MNLHNTTNIIDSSKINDFIKCRRYCMYAHFFGWKSLTPSNHLVFGEAWHLAMEYLLLNGYSMKSVAQAFELMLNKYRQTFPPETDEMFGAKTPENAFIVLAKYAQKYARDLEQFEVLYTEIAGSVSIGEGKQINFRMDSVLRELANKKISSLEHKTGSSTYMWLEQWILSIQFGTYTHVLNCLFPAEEIDAVYVNGVFFGKGIKAWAELRATGETTMKTIPYDFLREPVKKSRNQMQVWLDTINYYYDELKMEAQLLVDAKDSDEVLRAFPLNPLSCGSYGHVCEYKDFCTAWANPLRKLSDEAPLGFKIEFWNPLEREAKQVFTL